MDDSKPRNEKQEEEVVATPIHSVNLENLPQQKHIWIDRGIKRTCENAGHPYHEVWLKQK